VACHTLGARIQIVIADASAVEDNGCLLRRGRCPLFEQPMRQLWFRADSALSFQLASMRCISSSASMRRSQMRGVGTGSRQQVGEVTRHGLDNGDIE
jgi:hypothetical protein